MAQSMTLEPKRRLKLMQFLRVKTNMTNIKIVIGIWSGFGHPGHSLASPLSYTCVYCSNAAVLQPAHVRTAAASAAAPPGQ